MIWLAVLLGSVGCYACKLAGLRVPAQVLDDPRARRVAELMPVALLAALASAQTFTSGRSLAVDPRAAGAAVAVLAVVLRAPFILVVLAAAGTAALVRLLA